MPKKLLFFLFVIVFLVVVIIIWPKKGVQRAVNNFAECAAAGNPIMESYPRQCTTKSGTVYIETIIEEK